jgi:hypothetical protein
VYCMVHCRQRCFCRSVALLCPVLAGVSSHHTFMAAGLCTGLVRVGSLVGVVLLTLGSHMIGRWEHVLGAWPCAVALCVDCTPPGACHMQQLVCMIHMARHGAALMAAGWRSPSS